MKTNLENITNRIKETLTEKSKEAGKKVPRPVVIGITSAALAIGSMIGADVAEAYGPEFKERQATITQQVDEIGGYVPAFANPVHGRAGTSRDSCASGSFRDMPDTDTEYRWACLGWYGGQVETASMDKIVDEVAIATQASGTPVHGQAGTSRNTCASGSFRDMADTDRKYRWQCRGLNGGNDVIAAMFKPKPVDEVGGRPQKPLSDSAPVNAMAGSGVNSCRLGNLKDLPDTLNEFIWKCEGLNGGGEVIKYKRTPSSFRALYEAVTPK